MINLYRTSKDFKSYIAPIDANQIGLVPTMGNLHQGHLSLIAESLKNHNVTIITIFINPKQFSEDEDFDSYPRTLDNDLALISSIGRKFLKKNIAVFAPLESREIYPKEFSTIIKVQNHMANILCGKTRPEHFQGVTTVVYKLFQITKAKYAYFGQKDFQQFKIIEKMVFDLELNIQLNMMPIIREENGLALSSRNCFLDSTQKNHSLILSTALNNIGKLLLSKNIHEAIKCADELEQNEFEYMQVLDAANLKAVSESTLKFVILGALKLGKTRLIDNILVVLDAR